MSAPRPAPPAARPVEEARRTVRIQGLGAERNLPRRLPPLVNERTGMGPDRLAMWAVLLGFLLVLVAGASTHF